MHNTYVVKNSFEITISDIYYLIQLSFNSKRKFYDDKRLRLFIIPYAQL